MCFKEGTNKILGVGWTQNMTQIRYTLENRRFYRSGNLWDGPRGEGKVEHSMEKGY